MKKLLFVLAFFPALLLAQSRKERKALEAQQKADQVVVNNLKNHIQHLTGGNTTTEIGSPNQSKTAAYISSQFKLLGLQPKGTDGFFQAFKVDNGKKIDAATYLKVNDKLAEVGADYFPLSYSAEKKVKGKPAMALRERGVPWFIDLKEWIDEGLKVQGDTVNETIKKEIVKVATKGATALFLYNTSTTADGLAFNAKDKAIASPIPVIYVTQTGMKKYFSDHSEVLDIDLNVGFTENLIAGTNVAGYINNAAASTVIISAHHQAGKRGKNGKSEGPATIAIGADDNASGIATLIELAKMLGSSKAKNNNYLFLALDGLDNGSGAGSYWLGNTANTASINYVVNLDMVGSYSDSKKLAIHGYSTSPLWKQIITSIPDKKVELAIDSSNGAGEPMAVFYKKEIPGLSFSSALHTDYETGFDEENKINYAGTLLILKFVDRIIEAADSKGRIGFEKGALTPATTTVQQANIRSGKTDDSGVATTKTSVSLGVIPDRTISQSGLKISGVTPKKIASKLGLEPGDVLTSLGSYPISDLKTYLQALSNFKAGDKTSLRIKRGADDKEFAVEF